MIREYEVKTQKSERKTIKNVVKWLTSYGETLKGNHGENIVNKLMLENRLKVYLTPDITD